MARASWYRRTEGIQLNQSERVNAKAMAAQPEIPLPSRRFADGMHCLFSHGAKQRQCQVLVFCSTSPNSTNNGVTAERATKGASHEATTKVTAAGCAMTTFPSVTTGATTSTRDKKLSGAVFRQSGNNRGADLEDGRVYVSLMSARREGSREKQNETGNSAALRDGVILGKQVHDALAPITSSV